MCATQAFNNYFIEFDKLREFVQTTVLQLEDEYLAELIISKMIDIYKIYLVQLIEEIYVANPQRLRSEATRTLNDILQYNTMQEFIHSVIKSKMQEISHYSLHEITVLMDKKFKFKLFTLPDIEEKITELNEIRNLIVHNHGKVNEKFKKKFPNNPAEVGEKVILDLGEKISDCFGLVRFSAEEIDERAIDKFGLKTFEPVFGAFENLSELMVHDND